MIDKRNKFLNGCASAGIEDPWEYVKTLYLQGLSCNALSELFKEKHNIDVTPKHLSTKIKELGLMRSHSERKLNAMRVGRMVYTKKPKHQLYKSKSVSSKLRADVLHRDKYRCRMCGNGPKDGYAIEIHHIDGPESTFDNLDTLCFQCHRGKHQQ